MGLVTSVVEPAELEVAALAVAGTIAAHSPLGLWFTKELIAHAADAPSLDAALALENRSQVLGFLTGNVLEAAAAFSEGRPPRFDV
jgi:enoyl-CoA hydratase/carnithine racemase